MKDKMNHFISWLESDLTHFVSLVEEGSTVTGDPWQEGFSDHDITIIISQDIDAEMAAVSNWLKHNHFDNSYLFGPRLMHEFIHGNSLNDISMKFRAKTILGKDLIAEKDFPDRQVAIDIGRTGLKNLEIRCLRRLVNLSYWTLEYAQKKNYEIFKNFFVFSGARIYGESGLYPIKRTDVAEIISQQQDISSLLYVTNNISTASKQVQEEALQTAITYIRQM